MKVSERVKSAIWGIGLAWKMNKAMLSGWVLLSTILSILPAVALMYNKEIVSRISSFLSTGSGRFSDIASYIILLGIILTVSGLSARISAELLSMVMYDSYYLGMEEIMMDSAQRIDLVEFAKKGTSDEYHSVIMRGGSLTDFISGFCLLAGKITSVISLLVVAVKVSMVIFIASVIYIALIVWLNFRFSDKVRLNWEKQQRELRHAEYFERLTQETDTAKEIRIFESIDSIIRQWLDKYRVVEKGEVGRTVGIAMQTLISSLGFYAFMGIIVTYSILQVSQSMMDPGLFLTIFTLCLNISAAAANVTYGYQKMDYGLFSLDRQRRFFQNTPAKNMKEEEQKESSFLDKDTCFETKNLCFSYLDDKPVLKSLNFKIKFGETVALVGNNGSGKTTLVKLLLGLYRPESGELKFGGRSYEEYSHGFLTKKVGVFFQDFFLYHLTMRENVGAGSVEHMDNTDMVLQAISRGGAYPVLTKLPKGLDNMLGKQNYKDGAELSGGEKQRVAVSRAHMSEKDVLIFDEPASMLDPIAEMEQFQKIKDRTRQKTSILISHRVGFARLADRILVLHNGEIVEDGTHEQLIKANGVYAEFFEKQAKWYDTSEAAANEVVAK